MIKVRPKGITNYQQTWEEMKSFTEKRQLDTPDELWLLEHKNVFTHGLSGKPEHLLKETKIPVIKSDRGGQITYHGPGQLIIYCLIDIKRLGIGIKKIVSLIEQSLIELLSNYDINANTIQGAPGVYVEGAKIAALGLKVKQGKITSVLNSEEATSIKNELNNFKEIIIHDIKTSERKMRPSAPFTTASLQRAAYSTLGFSVKQTSSIAQRLYQGIALEDGETVGLISYMRTDSTNLSNDCLKDIGGFLDSNYPKLKAEEVRKYSKKVKNAQEAHEAIRPTVINNTPSKIKK